MREIEEGRKEGRKEGRGREEEEDGGKDSLTPCAAVEQYILVVKDKIVCVECFRIVVISLFTELHHNIND